MLLTHFYTSEQLFFIFGGRESPNLFTMGVGQRVAMDSLKVLPKPVMPYLSKTTSETTLQQRWPARRAGGPQPSSTPLDTPRRTPLPFTRKIRTRRHVEIKMKIIEPHLEIQKFVVNLDSAASLWLTPLHLADRPHGIGVGCQKTYPWREVGCPR
jgi:hypothetical protein